MRYENERSPRSSYLQPPFITVSAALLVMMVFLVVYVIRVEQRFSQYAASTKTDQTHMTELSDGLQKVIEDMGAIREQLFETTEELEKFAKAADGKAPAKDLDEAKQLLTAMQGQFATLSLRADSFATGENVAAVSQDLRKINSLIENLKARQVRVETGMIYMDHTKGMPQLMEGVGGGPRRGHLNQRIRFPKPFASTPEVVMTLSMIDIIRGHNHRLVVEVRSVDEKGFNYDFATWGDTQIWRASASWIAVGMPD